MKELIRERARELGFDACHFTSAAPPDHSFKFEEWLKEGRHGEMQYLARNAAKRVDPQLVLPGAKSVVVLAASYAKGIEEKFKKSDSSIGEALLPHEPGPSPQPSPIRWEREQENPFARSADRNAGVVARYAQYEDYHLALAKKLTELTNYLTSQITAPSRSLWYVDTGPLLERDLAMRAGLGFIGKHTNLISRKLGNWFFISEILTTVEFEPDQPEHNRCGSCTRCITACPTGAILKPFELDARKCISYLTIELKGSIPVQYRKQIGSRIYGCDDCLNACPWNRFAKEGSIMKQHGRSDLDQPDLLELLALDDRAFKARFANSPILRTKRRGFLRNVCVALGNAGDERALPALQKAATDHEPLIAEHAQWAMEQIESRLNRSADIPVRKPPGAERLFEIYRGLPAK